MLEVLIFGIGLPISLLAFLLIILIVSDKKGK